MFERVHFNGCSVSVILAAIIFASRKPFKNGERLTFAQERQQSHYELFTYYAENKCKFLFCNIKWAVK